jgi:outer membrane protein
MARLYGISFLIAGRIRRYFPLMDEGVSGEEPTQIARLPRGTGRFLLGCTAMFLSLAAGFPVFADQPAPQAASSSASAPEAQPLVTLEECVEAAKSGAPGLKIAGFTLDSARAAFSQVRAANGVSLGGAGSYFHQGDFAGLSGLSGSTLLAGSGENIQGTLSLGGPNTSVGLVAKHAIEDRTINQASSIGLTGSQTVFDGFPGSRAAASTRAAEYTYRVAQVTYDSALKSLLYQVKQACYALLADQNTVRVRQATLQQANENFIVMQGLFNAQRATKLDVLQVQFNLTQAQLDLRTAENAVETDRRRLSLAVGWPQDKQYQVAESAPPALPSLDPAEALKTALENRPELKTLQLNKASASVSQQLYKSQYSPVVSLTGSLDLGQNWTTNDQQGSFTAGAKIALPPLFDGGQRRAQLKQASDQISSYAVQEDQQRQSILIDVQNALFGVKDARDRLDLAHLNVQQAQGQYDLEKAKLTVGVGTTLDLLTAFSVLTTAQVGLVQAGSNYALALLNLQNVMGL